MEVDYSLFNITHSILRFLYYLRYNAAEALDIFATFLCQLNFFFKNVLLITAYLFSISKKNRLQEILDADGKFLHKKKFPNKNFKAG